MIETRTNDSNNEAPMRERMRKVVNVIKPQSQNDTAHNKPILPAFLPVSIDLFTPVLNGNGK
jgi:hypothetical protein